MASVTATPASPQPSPSAAAGTSAASAAPTLTGSVSAPSKTRNVEFVLLAEFDIDKGSVLKYQYPSPTLVSERYRLLPVRHMAGSPLIVCACACMIWSVHWQNRCYRRVHTCVKQIGLYSSCHIVYDRVIGRAQSERAGGWILTRCVM